jgi:hypothetical protein
MIYTFYSFKGGVGRSMALANIAELLRERGHNVLIVDFDLEAPGLERFFNTPKSLMKPDDVLGKRGVMDLLLSYKDLRSSPARNPPQPGGDEGEEAQAAQAPIITEPLGLFRVPIYDAEDVEAADGTRTKHGSLALIPAGQRDGRNFSDYARRLRSFDWEDFYDNWDGQRFFERFREEAEALADVVLIDSRTGVTEMSGVCTYQLADVVIMFAASNHQNLEGILIMAQSLANPELIKKGRGGRALSLVFVPSRIEQTAESWLLDRFAEEFGKTLGPYVEPELKFEQSIFLDLMIPYVPYYSFMENVAVRDRDRVSATHMISAYDRLASILERLRPAPEEPVGALAADSPFYVERQWDRKALKVVQRDTEPISIQGPRHVGKSSLLRRMVASAEAAGRRAVVLDFQQFDQKALTDEGAFFRLFCCLLSKRLGLEDRSEVFLSQDSSIQGCTAYVEEHLLPRLDVPLLLGLDRVDMLFETGFRIDFFAMLRTWHNLRSEFPVWKKLILVLVTTIDPYELITDPHRSPFNVARQYFVLTDFTLDQVAQLNKLYGSPLERDEVERLFKVFGGIPSLVHKALYAVAKDHLPAGDLFRPVADCENLFADDLRKLSLRLDQSPELTSAMRQVVAERKCASDQLFVRLYSAGLVAGKGKDKAFSRCQLYDDYFREHFHV